jgi:hypothetical protein
MFGDLRTTVDAPSCCTAFPCPLFTRCGIDLQRAVLARPSALSVISRFKASVSILLASFPPLASSPFQKLHRLDVEGSGSCDQPVLRFGFALA